MTHSKPSKGTVLRLFNIVVQVSFSHAHLAHVGHKALANFSSLRELFSVGSATSGDNRRRSATVGMYTSGRGPKKVHLSASILFAHI